MPPSMAVLIRSSAPAWSTLLMSLKSPLPSPKAHSSEAEFRYYETRIAERFVFHLSASLAAQGCRDRRAQPLRCVADLVGGDDERRNEAQRVASGGIDHQSVIESVRDEIAGLVGCAHRQAQHEPDPARHLEHGVELARDRGERRAQQRADGRDVFVEVDDVANLEMFERRGRGYGRAAERRAVIAG